MRGRTNPDTLPGTREQQRRGRVCEWGGGVSEWERWRGCEDRTRSRASYQMSNHLCAGNSSEVVNTLAVTPLGSSLDLIHLSQATRDCSAYCGGNACWAHHSPQQVNSDIIGSEEKTHIKTPPHHPKIEELQPGAAKRVCYVWPRQSFSRLRKQLEDWLHIQWSLFARHKTLSCLIQFLRNARQLEINILKPLVIIMWSIPSCSNGAGSIMIKVRCSHHQHIL